MAVFVERMPACFIEISMLLYSVALNGCHILNLQLTRSLANSVTAFTFSPFCTNSLANPSLNRRIILSAKFCHSITPCWAFFKSKSRVSVIASPLMSPLDLTSFGKRKVQEVFICIFSNKSCRLSSIPCGLGGALNSALPLPSIDLSCKMILPASFFVVSDKLPLIYRMPQPFRF